MSMPEEQFEVFMGYLGDESNATTKCECLDALTQTIKYGNLSQQQCNLLFVRMNELMGFDDPDVSVAVMILITEFVSCQPERILSYSEKFLDIVTA